MQKWPLVIEQLHLGHIYNPGHGTHLGAKLCTRYGGILEGSFDEFSNEISASVPYFDSLTTSFGDN